MFRFRTKKSRAENFWREFKLWESATKTEKAPIERLEFEINLFLSKHFSGVFGVLKLNEQAEFELMFTAEGMPRHVPKVIEIMADAPTIKLWNWRAFRPGAPNLKQVEYSGRILKLSDVYFEYAKDRAKLGIKVFVRGYGQNNIGEAISYRLIDRFIGEYEVFEKIKWIDLNPLDETLVAQHFPLSHLPNIISGYDLEMKN